MSQTPVVITPGTGGASIAAELVAGTSFQQVEIYGGGGSSVLTVNPDGSLKTSIIGTPTITLTGSPSISGAVTIVGNPSISGTVNVAGLQGTSVSGTVNITGNPSISGTVLIGNSPSIYGNISGSVVGFQGGAWTVSVMGGPVTLYAPSTSYVSGVTSIITGTAGVSVIAAAPGGQRNYITHILVTNQQTSVTGTGTQVNIKDDGSGNVLYSGFAAAGGGGFSLTLPTPLRQPTSTFSISAAPVSQGSVLVSMSGYTAS